MSDVTKDVGRAINYAINDLICAISWLIISLGAIAICFFSYKFAKVNEASNSYTEGTTEEKAKREVEEKPVEKKQTYNYG